MARLVSTVHVQSPAGEFVTLGPDSDLPDWAGSVISNEKAWENSEVPEAAAPESDEKPAGNASLEEWTAYALKQGYTEADLEGKKRDDVRDMLA